MTKEISINVNSKKYKLNKKDLKKISKGFLIATAGAGIAYLLNILPSIDFGIYTPTIAVVCATLFNSILKYINGKK